MFQPLDYMFEIIILIMLLYGAFQFWNEYMRVKATKDDLLERYVIYEGWRQSKNKKGLSSKAS